MSQRRPRRPPRREDRASALARGAGRVLAVAVAAGAAGALLGLGIAALTGDDDSSSPSPPTVGTPTTTTEAPTSTSAARTTPTPTSTLTTPTSMTTAPTTTTTTTTTTAPAPASSAARPRVDVLSTVAHPVTAPAGDTRRRARVSVHVRVTNGTGRRIAPAPPVLAVGDARLQIAPGSSGAAAPLLAALDPGAVADGRLRFDTEAAVTAQLTTARVRLLIAGTTVTVTPVIGSPTASG
jgi:hypothetical protein